MKYCFFSFSLRFRRNTSKTCGFCARFAETTRKRIVSGSFASNFIQTLLFILFRRNRARNDNKNYCLSYNVAQTLAIYTVSEHPNVARARNSIKTYRFRSKVAETIVIYTVSEWRFFRRARNSYKTYHFRPWVAQTLAIFIISAPLFFCAPETTTKSTVSGALLPKRYVFPWFRRSIFWFLSG